MSLFGSCRINPPYLTHHSSVVVQSAPEDGVGHVEAVSVHAQEAASGVNKEAVSAGVKLQLGRDLAQGWDDHTEHSELVLVSQGPDAVSDLTSDGGRALASGDENHNPGGAVQSLDSLGEAA